MASHSSTLAWKIPWMEGPGRLQSMGSLRVRHDWATSLSLFTFHFHALEKEMATHTSVLAWRIPGTGEPGELRSLGSHRAGHDWSDLAAAAAAAEVVVYKNPAFKILSRHVSGSPVVKTSYSQGKGYQFEPWSGNQEPTCCLARPKTIICQNIFFIYLFFIEG